MRITHAIDLATRTVYNPSMQTLMLGGEPQRILRADCLVWDKENCPSLASRCVEVIADNFEKCPIYMEIPCWERDYLLEILSTDLELELVVPLIESEYYWKRRFKDHFRKVTEVKHYGWTWKCLYLENHVQKMCEEAEPQYADETKFAAILDICAPYIHKLTINKLQYWKHPLTSLPHERPANLPNDHINFVPILQRLPNVQEVSLSFKIDNVGDTFELNFLNVSLADCKHLAEAVGCLKNLKVLRLHNSAVDCSHVQELIKASTTASIVLLDLSHCRIGITGAKCIALYCQTHENLKILKLRNNRIGVEGAEGLAWMLMSVEGARLEYLDLSLNPLGSEGVMAIFKALVRSRSLYELNVNNCHTKEEPRVYLGAMLKVNLSLKALTISCNELHPEEGSEILKGLEVNSSLLSLDLRNTGIPLDIQSEIGIYLKRNMVASVKDKREVKESIAYSYIDSDSVVYSI